MVSEASKEAFYEIRAKALEIPVDFPIRDWVLTRLDLFPPVFDELSDTDLADAIVSVLCEAVTVANERLVDAMVSEMSGKGYAQIGDLKWE